MAKRAKRQAKAFHPALGRYFVELRTEKGWGQRQAATFAEGRGLKLLTHQMVLLLEKGRIKAPDPDAIRQIAELYGRDEDEVLRTVIRHVYRYDLARQAEERGLTSDEHPTPQEGAHTDGAARSDSRLLQAQRRETIDALTQIITIANAHIVNLGFSDEAQRVGSTSTPPRRGRRGHRR